MRDASSTYAKVCALKYCLRPHAVLAIAVLASACGSKTELKLSVKPGDKRVLRQEDNVTTSMSMAGMSMDTTQNVTVEYGVEVSEVAADGGATLKFTVNSYRQEQSVPMQDMMPGGGDMLREQSEKMSQALTGKVLTANVTPLGEVTSVEGAAEVEKAVTESVLAKLEGAAKAMAQTQMSQVLGESAFQDQLGVFFLGYREEPIKAGDTWTDTLTLNSGFEQHFLLTYKVASVTNGIATLDVTAEVDPDKPSKMSMGPISMDMKLTGSGEGRLTIDTATGWVLKHERNMSFEGEMSMSGGGAPGNMSMPMKITSKSLIESFSE